MIKSGMVVGCCSLLVACAAVDDVREQQPEPVGTTEQDLFGTPKPFDVTFTNCEDTAGITPVSRAVADPFVPPGYTMSGTDTAAFIVRLASCQGVSVEGGPARPATVVQVGVTVVSPDGNTANINNYTDWYYTDHLVLALRLALVGVHAEWVPGLDYRYTKNAAGTGGDLFVGVPGHPALTISGTVNEPVATPVLYVSNWWAEGPRGRVQMTSTLPAIAFGTASLSIATPPSSPIATLLGGPSAVFASFHSFSRSTPEVMHVAVLP